MYDEQSEEGRRRSVTGRADRHSYPGVLSASIILFYLFIFIVWSVLALLVGLVFFDLS